MTNANTAHGGINPFPFGVYMLNGDPAEIPNLPADLENIPFLEMLPCDRQDRRALRLNWNESGTGAEFSFVAMLSLLGISAPDGTTLWLDAVPVTDANGKPIMLLPLGNRIKRQAVQEAAASSQPPAAGTK